MVELQAKHTDVVSKHHKELSEAYSSGFLAFLKAFLGADPDYDWAATFSDYDWSTSRLNMLSRSRLKGRGLRRSASQRRSLRRL